MEEKKIVNRKHMTDRDHEAGPPEVFLTATSEATLGTESGLLATQVLDSKPDKVPDSNPAKANDDGPRFHLSKIEFFLVFVGLALAVFLASLDLVSFIPFVFLQSHKY